MLLRSQSTGIIEKYLGESKGSNVSAGDSWIPRALCLPVGPGGSCPSPRIWPLVARAYSSCTNLSQQAAKTPAGSSGRTIPFFSVVQDNYISIVFFWSQPSLLATIVSLHRANTRGKGHWPIIGFPTKKTINHIATYNLHGRAPGLSLP